MLEFLTDIRYGKTYGYRIIRDTDQDDFFVDVSFKRSNLLRERRRFSTLSSARVYVSKHLKY